MLRQLMLGKKIAQRKSDLNALLERAKGLATREAELEAALNEAKTDEEIAAVEESTTQLEADKTDIDQKKSALETEISTLETELEQLNSKDPTITPPAGSAERKNVQGGETRMRNGRFFNGMAREAVNALIARDEVKEFLSRAREFIGAKRTVTGAELNIPDVFLEVLRDNMTRYSKLASKVFTKKVSGKARQTLAGTVPEGVWTEAVGKLNELSISFSQVEVDGYKVGGFVAIPNSTLEDSDLDLASEIMDAVGQSIGLGLDKAIVYGTGTKMPLGYVTRLAQTAEPSSWNDNAPEWTDLHTTNILKLNINTSTGAAFFASLIAALGVASPKYSNGKAFWVMNRATHIAIMAKALAFDAAAALVAGVKNEMPVIGGEIIELEFMSNNDIAGGYGSLYMLAERAGAQLTMSEHAKFIEDQTVFKGTARYDGKPILGEAFVLVNFANVDPATTKTFASDAANP